ncbi:hypothetical protein JHK84_032637 [Glycine max]|nr:hypothetical protein JHK84_032637 [Glycine max]
MNKAGKNARQVQIRECFPQPLKERLDEGREMRRGKENAFGDRDFFLFFIENEEGRGWPTRVEWPRADLFGYIIKRVELREQPSDGKLLSRSVQRALYFSSRILRSLSCEFPSGEFKTFLALSIPSLEPRRKPPSPSDSISLLTLYMWAPDIYEGSPTPVTAFLSIAPKISIFANISRVSIYGSYGATLQQIFCFCSIASMILGALAAMAQTKVKRPLAHSSIGHVGYIRTGFSCGTIEGIQSLLIGILIYALMTIDAFAIVLALRQTRVKYIADLGALAKTNPISAITFSITMFSYVGIPPLAGFCSKFYLFFAALGCGAYFLAPVGVVTSVIGCWAAGRLPRVSQFGGPKAVLRAPDT